MFKIVACSVLLAALASTASAATYQTILNFTPTGDSGTSSDPADGNQIVIDWDTALTTGPVNQGDLTDLTLSLFGTGGLIFTDMAIIGGSAQPIGGVARVLSDISFEFDLDVAPSGDFAGLNSLDNDGPVVQSNGIGITYNILGDFSLVSAFYFSDGSEDESLWVEGIPVATVAPIPLPPAGLALFAGITALIGLGRKRRAT